MTSSPETAYDLWIADEGWEIDHFLHEHPALKAAPFVWMTDFVGHLPLAEGGACEAELTADYNAEMVEHVDRHPGVRDRAIFIGDFEDTVEESLGPGCRRSAHGPRSTSSSSATCAAPRM